MEKVIKIIETILLSAVPILEQKFSILFALNQHVFFIADKVALTDVEAYIYTLIGALIPAPLILLFIPAIFGFLKKYQKLGKLVTWYEKRALKKGKNIVKYELLGLFIFVAIPLPGTGVWTGSAVAALLGLDFKKSLFTVILGAITCGIILMFVYKGFIELFWI